MFLEDAWTEFHFHQTLPIANVLSCWIYKITIHHINDIKCSDISYSLKSLLLATGIIEHKLIFLFKEKQLLPLWVQHLRVRYLWIIICSKFLNNSLFGKLKDHLNILYELPSNNGFLFYMIEWRQDGDGDKI